MSKPNFTTFSFKACFGRTISIVTSRRVCWYPKCNELYKLPAYALGVRRKSYDQFINVIKFWILIYKILHMEMLFSLDMHVYTLYKEIFYIDIKSAAIVNLILGFD